MRFRYDKLQLIGAEECTVLEGFNLQQKLDLYDS